VEEMSGWTEDDLRKQFQRAKKNGWLQIFKRAAETYGFPPELIMAIASRETNMRNVIGGKHHGSADYCDFRHHYRGSSETSSL